MELGVIEQWRDIPGYEGVYQVSDQGRVRSLDRAVRAVAKNGAEYRRRVSGVVLSPGVSRGYKIVNLHPHGTIAVHLVVARVFVPNPDSLPEVNHKDGVKENCCVDNLEWVTKSGNQLHAVNLGLKKQAKRVRTPSGNEYPSIAQAAKAECVSHRTAAAWAGHV